MGVKPSGYKTGGFLNGVDVVWEGYAFQAKTFTAKVGDNAGEDFTPVNLELTFRLDGADEPVKTWLRMGLADSWGGIMEDGKRLGTPDGQSLSSNSQVGTFIASLVQAGLAEKELDADDNPEYLSFEHLVSQKPRLRLIQPVNVEKTEKFGQQKNRKTGKTFDRRDLKVEKFYGFTASSQNGGKKAINGSGKTIEPKTEDLTDLAVKTLQGILKDAGGSIVKTKLPVKVGQKLSKHPQFEDVRKLVCSDAFLRSGGPNGGSDWAYDADTQTISSV
jgi:hypothetical protein